MKLKPVLVTLSMLFIVTDIMAQAQSPCDANPFCSDSAYDFPNLSGAGSAISGPEYGCLGSEPNAIWYYMQIGTSGPMQLSIYQTSTSGNGIDVDFAMWGPFTSLEDGCQQVMAGDAPVQCSYSASASETIGLGMPGGAYDGASTPPEAQVGEVYIVVLTNYNGSPGSISFEQTAGTGSADCGIVCGLYADNSGPVCQGGNIQLMASTTDTENTFTYYWSGPGGFSATGQNVNYTATQTGELTFTVISVNQEGDTCTQTTTDTVYPTYHYTASQEICLGATYAWYGRTIFQPGQYDTAFSTIHGCDSSYTLNLVINPLPDVKTAANNTNICAGDSTVLNIAGPSANTAYQWLKNGSTILNETGNYFIASDAGDYALAGITNKGCADTSNVITISLSPAADAKILGLSRSADDLCLDDTITVSAREYADYQYHWSPEKYFRSNASYFYPSATITVSDTKTPVQLMTMNAFGCRAYDSMVIFAHPCCDVYMPSAFTPNGDGNNDYFFPILRPYQQIVSFKIFDRYGKMVYDNNDPIKGWNGNYPNGDKAATDTYMYMIKYTCTDGQVYTDKSDLTLVR